MSILIFYWRQSHHPHILFVYSYVEAFCCTNPVIIKADWSNFFPHHMRKYLYIAYDVFAYMRYIVYISYKKEKTYFVTIITKTYPRHQTGMGITMVKVLGIYFPCLFSLSQFPGWKMRKYDDTVLLFNSFLRYASLNWYHVKTRTYASLNWHHVKTWPFWNWFAFQAKRIKFSFWKTNAWPFACLNKSSLCIIKMVSRSITYVKNMGNETYWSDLLYHRNCCTNNCFFPDVVFILEIWLLAVISLHWL